MSDRDKEESFGWKSPIGWIQVTGKTAVVAGLLVAVGVLIWRHDERSAEQATANAQQNQATVEALREMAFVLTLSETERKALNLAMPASMRERLLRQERERRRSYEQ